MSSRKSERSDAEQSASSVETVAVLGAGTMGHSIAFVAAAGGCAVRLFDVDEDALAAAEEKIRATATTVADSGVYDFETTTEVTDRIEYETAIEAAVRDVGLVIEAVPEVREIKLETFEEVDRHVDRETVIATNTSSLPLDDLVGPITEPERFCGMHWFNPPHIVPVVEVVYGDRTTDETIQTASAFLRGIGKDPIVVERDIPGFIANRIQSAMAREVWALLEAGVASPEDIDRAIKGTFGFRLPILGVFEKSDYSGLDVHHTVLGELLPEIDRRTEPAAALSDLVEDGHYGAKTGRGVYDWSGIDLEAVTEERDQRLLEILEAYRKSGGPPPTAE